MTTGILNLRHIFASYSLILKVARLDCKITVKSTSVISRMIVTYVPTIGIVAVDFPSENFGSLPPYEFMAGIGPAT